MDWGLLQGLGQGLQQLGGMKMEEDAEKRRAMLAEKLRDDREKKEQLKYDPQQDEVKTGDNGVLFKVKHSKDGTEIGREPLDPLKAAEIKRNIEKENVSIESLRSGIDTNKITADAKRKEMAWEEEDRSLLTPEQRKAQALIDAKLAPSADTKYSTDGSIQRAVLAESGRASRADDEVDNATIADYAEDYLDQNPGIAAKYVDTKVLTENQAKDAVIQVLREFSKRGVKPTQADFTAALESYARNVPKKSADKTDGIKMRITGQ